MKTITEIHDAIKKRFETKVQDTFQENSAIDLYTGAVSEELHDVYQEIEDNKTPHIWTGLTGENLDKTGTAVNLPRETGESDATYLYRLMNWTKINEASNTIAIQAAVLTPQYSSNIDYVPYTKGSGTGTCYVLPKHYTQENIEAALKEAAERISKVASPSLYIEYIIPKIRSVRLQINIETENGDTALIKEKLEQDIMEYINTIPPKSYLEIGHINKMGINTDNVKYFNVLSVIIDNESIDTIEVLQGIDTKLLFDDIIWTGDE
jgi:hypothetical protein